MDRSLDEIISERPRGGRRPERRPPPPPPRAPRREEYPRDGVRKNRRDERTNLDTDWVHDRFEDERHDRRSRPSPERDDRHGPQRQDTRAAEASGTKLRVDNLHYDLTEDDIQELFTRIGPVVSARLLYDRMDRSQGTAFITYADPRDAREAIREYDNANANGQPIRITQLPSAPAGDVRSRGPGGSLFDRVERPTRSLFDRIENGPVGRAEGRDYEGDGRRRRAGRDDRSYSPRKGGGGDRLRDSENVDRYVPGRRYSRSPVGRRGTPREPGRRPGARREESGRGAGAGAGAGAARRKGRLDEEGRPVVGGRPKKTAEELDAEMEDYWGSKPEETNTANGNAPAHNGNDAPATTTTAPALNTEDDIDMIE